MKTLVFQTLAAGLPHGLDGEVIVVPLGGPPPRHTRLLWPEDCFDAASYAALDAAAERLMATWWDGVSEYAGLVLGDLGQPYYALVEPLKLVALVRRALAIERPDQVVVSVAPAWRRLLSLEGQAVAYGSRRRAPALIAAAVQAAGYPLRTVLAPADEPLTIEPRLLRAVATRRARALFGRAVRLGSPAVLQPSGAGTPTPARVRVLLLAGSPRYGDILHPVARALLARDVAVTVLGLPGELPPNRLPHVRYATYGDYATPTAARAVAAAARDLATRWRRLQADAAFRARFAFEGVNFFDAVAEDLAHAYLVTFPFLAALAELGPRMLDAERPSAIASAFDGMGAHRLLMRQARARGIPSVGLFHGVLAAALPLRLGESDTLAAWGPAHVQQIAVLGLDASRCVVTGTPKLDPLAQPERVADPAIVARYGLAERPFLLWVATEYAGQLAWEHWTTHLAEARAIIAAAGGLSGWRLAIKPHPSEDPRPYAQAITSLQAKYAVLLPPDAPLYPLLHAAAVVLVGDSTVGLEAMAMGRPVITLRLRPGHGALPYAEEGAALALRRAADLPVLVRTLHELPAARARLLERAAAFVRAYGGDLDGQAAGRVADLLYALAHRLIRSPA